MGVYIPNMEMPTSCGFCVFEQENGDGCECYVNGCLTEYQKRPDDCPLVSVPPHGRLIDADAMCDGLVSNHPVVIHANAAPTVLPASEEGET